MTLAEHLTHARNTLVTAGVKRADASLDIDLFAREILGWDRARLLAEQRSIAVPGTLEPQLSEWVARRARHEPTAYIVGKREFWNLTFQVSPAVLIPRPETELIVEDVLAAASELRSPLIADIGTGSGCIAVSIAHGARSSTVVATDVSFDALAVARSNAAAHGVVERVRFVCTSYLDGIGGLVDIIAANPPYVRSGDKPALGRDVQHEPDVALFGGADGLRHVGGVLDASSKTLKPGGWLFMEFGYGQEDDVKEIVGKVMPIST